MGSQPKMISLAALAHPTSTVQSVTRPCQHLFFEHFLYILSISTATTLITYPDHRNPPLFLCPIKYVLCIEFQPVLYINERLCFLQCSSNQATVFLKMQMSHLTTSLPTSASNPWKSHLHGYFQDKCNWPTQLSWLEQYFSNFYMTRITWISAESFLIMKVFVWSSAPKTRTMVDQEDRHRQREWPCVLTSPGKRWG